MPFHCKSGSATLRKRHKSQRAAAAAVAPLTGRCCTKFAFIALVFFLMMELAPKAALCTRSAPKSSSVPQSDIADLRDKESALKVERIVENDEAPAALCQDEEDRRDAVGPCSSGPCSTAVEWKAGPSPCRSRWMRDSKVNRRGPVPPSGPSPVGNGSVTRQRPTSQP